MRSRRRNIREACLVVLLIGLRLPPRLPRSHSCFPGSGAGLSLSHAQQLFSVIRVKVEEGRKQWLRNY